jgi:hypothetical protein
MLRPKADPIERREDDHPEEIRVPLDALGTGVEHEPGPASEVAGVPEGDERVVAEEPIDRRMREQHGQGREQREPNAPIGRDRGRH